MALDKIYTRQEIDKARQSLPLAENTICNILGLIGNTFHQLDIDRAVQLGTKYNPNRVVVGSQRVLGLDPGWGSSAFGVVLIAGC